MGVNVACFCPVQGTYEITITGSFPVAQGVLMVSIASGESTTPDEFIAATITSWTTTQIKFTTLMVDSNGDPWSDDFSFIILGE